MATTAIANLQTAVLGACGATFVKKGRFKMILSLESP